MTYIPVNGFRIFVVELCILLATFVIVWPAMRYSHAQRQLPAWLAWLLARNWRGVVLVVFAALLARGLLIPVMGIPAPRINDEYSYLLMADTFAHHRLTNATPAAWQHFETFHVNMRPTYHSKYPVAHGLFLAFGQMVFGQPWVGVWLSTALLCGAICWALQAFVTPGWALLGGLLAVVRIALFSFWANSYFGPQVAALGGAVALGATVRIFDFDRSRMGRILLSCAFTVGLLILATSRPYEGLAFAIPLLGYCGYRVIKSKGNGRLVQDGLLPVILLGALGILVLGYYDHTTTGDAFVQPYPLNYQTYWPLPLFFGQSDTHQIVPADPVFAEYFKTIKKEYQFDKTKTAAGILSLEIRRFWEDWFFYVGPALTLPVLIGFASCLLRPRLRIVVLTFLATVVALAFYVYSMTHYAAVLMVVVFVFTVEGLRYLWDTRQHGERAFAIAIVVTVVVVSVTGQAAISSMNTAFRLPDQRKAITEQLQSWPGKHLVLVSYDLQRHYPGNELVHNGADFESERILWARSKGFASDLELCRAYPDRSFWGVNTDDVHFALRPLNLCRDGLVR